VNVPNRGIRRSVWAACVFGLAIAVPHGSGQGMSRVWENIEENLAGWADWMDETAARLVPTWTETARQQLEAYAWDLVQAVADALEGQDEQQLAELEPWVRWALEHVREMPELVPYASWLRTRLDYLSAVKAVVPARALPPPPGPPPEPLIPPRSVTPPSQPPWRPARTSPPPKLPPPRTSHVQMLASRKLWQERVRTSAPPKISSRELIPAVREAFRRERVPDALIWVAEVESGWDPTARSPRGALGLYQLMPVTARSLGLKVSQKEDERMDPVKSATAAARHLRQLHDRFGSWALALAAYNAGSARVARALQDTGGSSFEEIAPALPLETRMYVPRVLETIRVREGMDPDQIPRPRAASLQKNSDQNAHGCET